MKTQQRDTAKLPLAKSSDKGRLPLPHERDQGDQGGQRHDAGEPGGVDASAQDELDPNLIQAKKDLDSGLIDTDTRNSPGADAPARERLLSREQCGPGSGATAAAGQSKDSSRPPDFPHRG